MEALEATLRPLHDATWEDTLGGLGMLERAKMEITVSYAVNDLIWGE
jgi:hypothetical protein